MTKIETTKKQPQGKLSRPALTRFLAAQAPEGWTATAGTGSRFCGEHWSVERGARAGSVHVLFERTDGDLSVDVALNVTVPETPYERKWARREGTLYRGCIVQGDTGYNGRTFTRRGLDSCSVELRVKADPEAHVYADVPSMLQGEWARCLASHTRSLTALPVPGTPFTRQPEWFAASKSELLAGKTVTLTPSGMGTGYRISTRRPHRFATAAAAELERALGVTGLWIDRIDCD